MRKLGNLKKIREMLLIDYEYPDGHPKDSFEIRAGKSQKII